MEKKRIFFRVDSSSILGFGHLNRCLILAKELNNKNFEIHFICKNLLSSEGPNLKNFPLNALSSSNNIK